MGSKTCAPERLQLLVAHERARGQQGQAEIVRVGDGGLVGLHRARQAESGLAEHGHGHEVAGQGLAARVVTARCEERVVGDRAQDGRFDRLGMLVDERLLRPGALGQAGLLAAQGGRRDGDEVGHAGSVVFQGRARQLLRLRSGVAAHAGQEVGQGRREPLRLEIAQDLVEDLVPGVIGGIGGHEDGCARVVLLVIGVVEEAELLRHDDEALLGELAARLRGEEAVHEVGHSDAVERGRRGGPGVGGLVTEQRDQLVVAEADVDGGQLGGRGRGRIVLCQGGAGGHQAQGQAGDQQAWRDELRTVHRALLSMMAGSVRPSPSISTQVGTPGPGRGSTGRKPKTTQRQALVARVRRPSRVP